MGWLWRNSQESLTTQVLGKLRCSGPAAFGRRSASLVELSFIAGAHQAEPCRPYIRLCIK